MEKVIGTHSGGERLSRSASGIALMLVAIMAGCAGGCSSKETAEQAPTVSVQAATAQDAPIEDRVSADATLYPRDQAAIVPKVTAPVKKFFVERGSTVHKGQLLAELENADLAGAVTENQGGFQQAEVNYQSASQKAEQDLRLAKQQMDAQQKLYDSRKSLYEEGAVSGKDVQDAQIALTQAKNQYELAQKQFDLKNAQGQLTAAKGRASSAQAQLAYSKIVSPIEGVVTDRSLYAGETAPSGSPILTVMDISQVVARAHVAQQEAVHLKAGDEATISFAGNEVPGKITLVSPALDPNSTTVEIWVAVANPGGRLKPGASARVTMVAQSIKHAIVIPATALLTSADGTSSVIVLGANNAPHKQPVKVGIRDGENAQIVDGLKAGDRVVTVGAFELDKEDEDVLAKTKIQVQAPAAPGAAGAADHDEKDQ
jgi:RND family efflux transporter MFP subunit